MGTDRQIFHILRPAGALAIVAVAATGCASSGPASHSSPSSHAAPGVLSVGATRVSAAPPARAGADLSAFGGKIFLADSSISATSNSAISPYSIYTTLAMTRAGAKGATGTQLDHALGGSAKTQAADVTAIDAAVKSAVASANQSAKGKQTHTVVRPANSVWVDRSLHVRKPYLKSLASGYGAGLHTVDFRRNPTGSRDALNGWVKKRTNKLIPELLGPRDVTDQTRLELVNALYLKASWPDKMTVAKQQKPFTTASGTAERATYMTDHGSMAVGQGRGWRSVTVTYAGGGLAMTIVLPDAGDYRAVRQQLPSVITDATRAGTDTKVNLTMPKFSTTTHTSLVPALKKMGVKQLFAHSDLSGIAGKPGDLTVGSVVHQSVVKVDQFGTEAAAATAVGMQIGAAPVDQPVDFVINRAFFYVIHDTTTGAPLFLGQVADPAR